MSLNRISTLTTQKIIRSSGDPLRPGIPTQRFFATGEEQEATQYKNAQLPPDDAPASDPEAAFESFDKIPKKRPIVVIAAIGLLAGISIWAVGSRVLWAARTAPTPAATPASASNTNVAQTPPALSVAVPTPAPVAVADRPPIGPQVVPIPPDDVTLPARLADPVPAKHQARGKRAAPLRGYVWSPTTNSLAPAGRASVPATDRDLESGDRANLAAPSNPTPDHGNADIAPADTGAARPERDAPSADSIEPRPFTQPTQSP